MPSKQCNKKHAFVLVSLTSSDLTYCLQHFGTVEEVLRCRIAIQNHVFAAGWSSCRFPFPGPGQAFQHSRPELSPLDLKLQLVSGSYYSSRPSTALEKCTRAAKGHRYHNCFWVWHKMRHKTKAYYGRKWFLSQTGSRPSLEEVCRQQRGISFFYFLPGLKSDPLGPSCFGNPNKEL